jgi:hypothetical protein
MEVWDTRGAEGDAGCEDGEFGSDARHAAGGDSGGFERDHHLESLFFGKILFSFGNLCITTDAVP